jgi:FtsP/CotA-like multicopper oxidase with cupredoxin domain
MDPFPSPPESGAGPGQTVASSQPVSSLISATQGEKILLRISNLNVTNFYTLTALGLTMKVVGTGARQLRGSDGKDLSYETMSVTLGGGEAKEVIIDTAGVPAGTYYLYTTNLNFLSNNQEDFGGMMTEIQIL